MTRRSKLEISFETLGHIIHGAEKPTRIMYASNLSWQNLCSTLEGLLDSELIVKQAIGRQWRYYITQAGVHAYNEYSRLRQMVSESEP